jgi:hypothetical protein
MEEKSKIYRRKVFEFLESLEPGTFCEVDKMCIPANRALFVQCVKDYMDAFPWQGWLSFNKDYTKFYKIHPIIFSENKKI